MPRASISMAWARTMSRMVITGKARPQGWPVSGLIEDGPVEPLQPPNTLDEMMKCRAGSSGRPGPTIWVHQPGLPLTGLTPATCWSPVRAWQISTALLRSALSRP